MASSAYFYNNGLFRIVKQEINLETDIIKALLVSASYTFNADQDFVSEITNELTNLSGTGYSRKTINGMAVTKDDANDKIVIDCNDPTYTAINTNEDVRAIILYKEVTNDADSLLISYHQGEILPTNGSDLTVAINANGLGDILNNLA